MRLDAGRERDTVFSELAATSGGLSNGSGWQRLSLCRPQQVTLTLEKVSYDTLAAARGYDLEAEHEAKVAAAGGTLHGGFPSGGAALPNCSLIPVRGEQDRLILSWLGDRPRGEPVPPPAEGQEPARGT